MQVIVIGAGLAGVTTAWELSRSGHGVTVLDRGREPACETSHANAGLVATGHAMPWAAPRVPPVLVKSLFKPDQAFRLRPRLDWHMLRWGLRFLRQCTRTRHDENTIHEYRLCRYSQQCLRQVTEEAGLDYHSKRRGLLYVFRDEKALGEGFAHMKIVRDMGHEMRLVSAAEIERLDPAYAQCAGRIAGAVYCPEDESGDARLFTLGLAEACRAAGVSFEFDCTVERLVADNGRIRQLHTSLGARDADLYILASGVESPLLSRPAGFNLPIYPVKGYSVTFPVGAAHRPPDIGGVDESCLLAYCRLGDRLRVTSTAEIAGYDTSFEPADFEAMIRAFSTLMPEAADFGQRQYWSCLRPMTPNGRPVIGRSRYANLYLNTGHGNMGWTMACGSARLVADIIDGRDTEIPAGPMALH